MTPDEIAKSYDLLADRWQSQSFSPTHGLEQHERALAFLRERRHALDIGCGSSGRIIEFLTSRGFEAAER